MSPSPSPTPMFLWFNILSNLSILIVQFFLCRHAGSDLNPICVHKLSVYSAVRGFASITLCQILLSELGSLVALDVMFKF